MWTPAALRSEGHQWSGQIWRGVESQAKASTMRLTDSLEEQELLENVLERSKPNIPAECKGLHYLLATPFRYTPYPHGSRFRRAGQREGAFYGSETVETVIAELCFYRLLFFAESPGTLLPTVPVEHTIFAVDCAAELSLNLNVPPLNQYSNLWRHPVNYGPCQDLADKARQSGIQAIRYCSVRDPKGGTDCALLSASAFADPNPRSLQTWHVFPGTYSVRVWCESPRVAYEFVPDDFSNDPRLMPIRQPPPTPLRHRGQPPNRDGAPGARRRKAPPPGP